LNFAVVEAMEPAELLLNMVKALVDHPDDVRVYEANTPDGLILELDLHPDDWGQILGRRGGIANNIRKVLWAVGGKLEQRITLKIPDKDQRKKRRPK